MDTTRSIIANPYLLMTFALSGIIALYAFGSPTLSQANDPEGTCTSKSGCVAETCDKKGECAKKGCGCGCQGR